MSFTFSNKKDESDWRATRLEDGSVKLSSGVQQNELIIDADTWVSILSSVCARADTGTAHDIAMKMHNDFSED